MTKLFFDYLIPRTGNGLKTLIPNLKTEHLILQRIDFDFGTAESRPDIEVTLNHGNDKLKYPSSYFQIFDSINLREHWGRLIDGDHIEMLIKNQSNKQQSCHITYHYDESDGVILHSSHASVRELNDPSNTLFEDLFRQQLMTKIYFKSDSLPKLRLVPKFRYETEEAPCYQVPILSDDEMCLDFSDTELAEISSMLAFYRIEIETDSDPDKNIYILAYGFRA